ncbi:hypothetical protein L596_017878 [Steinernema carpocapsae]|uniref:Uncharacterized protein n=1 Tax=Steinernema carpocapsae TaxID=34508 RepID=A0A4U5N3S1_STECR|nr:hypothetical protein L596_017878 [Steinernema carpocapsae]
MASTSFADFHPHLTGYLVPFLHTKNLLQLHKFLGPQQLNWRTPIQKRLNACLQKTTVFVHGNRSLFNGYPSRSESRNLIRVLHTMDEENPFVVENEFLTARPKKIEIAEGLGPFMSEDSLKRTNFNMEIVRLMTLTAEELTFTRLKLSSYNVSFLSTFGGSKLKRLEVVLDHFEAAKQINDLIVAIVIKTSPRNKIRVKIDTSRCTLRNLDLFENSFLTLIRMGYENVFGLRCLSLHAGYGPHLIQCVEAWKENNFDIESLKLSAESVELEELVEYGFRVTRDNEEETRLELDIEDESMGIAIEFKRNGIESFKVSFETQSGNR